MNFLDKIKQRTNIVDHARIAIREASLKITSVVASSETKEARLATCNSCEFLFTPTMQCSKCGCFVKAKAAVQVFKCPMGKWENGTSHNSGVS